MSILAALFGHGRDRSALQPLYREIVAAARDPAWYRDDGVPDTVDGRFDILAALVALLLLRFEAEGAQARDAGVLLTECFIDDMDGSVRQLGTGDLMVGKRVGQMVGALGGRLGALRDAGAASQDFAPFVRRNIFHEGRMDEFKVDQVAGRMQAFHDRIRLTPLDALLAGPLPRP